MIQWWFKLKAEVTQGMRPLPCWGQLLVQCAAGLFYHLLQGLCALKQRPQSIQPEPLKLVRNKEWRKKTNISDYVLYDLRRMTNYDKSTYNRWWSKVVTNEIWKELTSPKIAPDAPTAGILQNR